MRRLYATALVVLFAAGATAAVAEEKYERNGRGEWTYERKDAGGEVKQEQRSDHFKSEFKDGRRESNQEAHRDGSWKEETKDGRCETKRERSADGQYKEEHKC